MEKSRYKIAHHTIYEFSAPVFLEPHTLRFRPKLIPFREIINFSLVISPNPSGIWESRSPEDNVTHLTWFNSETNRLEIKAESTVASISGDRFGFIIYPHDSNQLPLLYAEDIKSHLTPYLEPIADNNAIGSLTHHVKQQSSNDTLQFCIKLTQLIHQEFEREVRVLGDPYLPEKTLSEKKGSCRDLAYLQMAICRNAGIAARFVSGYHYSPFIDNHELHAWVEVYLPGAGWIGFDPTTGLATDHAYFPVASSALHLSTMPVSGTFRGQATSTLSTSVVIEPA